jgi:hypothetical protein
LCPGRPLPTRYALQSSNTLEITLALSGTAKKEDMDITHVKLYFPGQFINQLAAGWLQRSASPIPYQHLPEVLGRINTRINGHIPDLQNFEHPPLKPLRLNPDEDDNSPVKPALDNRFKTVDELPEADDRLFQLCQARLTRHELLLILKSSRKRVSEKLLKNMSRRAREDYLDQMEVKHTVKRWEIEGALHKLLSIINYLHNETR